MSEEENKTVLPFIRKKETKRDPVCSSCGKSFGPTEAGIEPCYPCQQFEERRTYAWVSLFPLNHGYTVEQAAAFADAALAEYDKRFKKRKQDD